MEEKLPEILSDEVQEVMSTPPKAIIRYGISTLLFIFIVLFTGSWFVKYPDIINAEVTLTSNNLPIDLISKASGKITHLFVNNEDTVVKEQILAVIENTAHYDDVLRIDSLMQIFDINNTEQIFEIGEVKQIILGELQQTFQGFQKACVDYKQYMEVDFLGQKNKALISQLTLNKSYLKQAQIQINLQKEELQLSENEFKRDSSLHSKKHISTSEFEKSSRTFIQQKNALNNANTGLIRINMEISQLEQQIAENHLNIQDKNSQLHHNIEMSKNTLMNSINNWKNNYLITSPISGKITFTNIREINQNVIANSSIFSIIPLEKTKILGIMNLPMQGAGKVKVGQTVNIKLDNYPHIEFGMVKGIIQTISLVPLEKEYIVEISFPNELKTNYNKKLELTEQMTGLAEIITEDIRLLERIFNPLKSILKNNT
ncbi:MAG: HlyD family efflux transporter periplasmic adaptor subunit [Bacteroidales bacterium]|nr:HlyD family efflux transporter periplasmic adaptor subunit [Bacteroidales bacterium]